MTRLEGEVCFCALEEATDTAALVRGIAVALTRIPAPPPKPCRGTS